MTDSTLSNTILQGTYTGLTILKKREDSWKFSHKLTGYNEPVKKFVIYRSNDIWVTGPNTGLTRLTTDAFLNSVIQVRKYGAKDGIVDESNLDINFLNGKILVNDGRFHYYYEQASDSFKKDPYLNQFTPGYLIRMVDHQYWCRVYNDSVVVMKDSVSAHKFKIGLNKDYHSIGEISDGQLIFSLNEGYAIFQSSVDINTRQDAKIIADKNVLLNTDYCIPSQSSAAGVGMHGRPALPRVATYVFRAGPDQALWLERWGEQVLMGAATAVSSHDVHFLPGS